MRALIIIDIQNGLTRKKTLHNDDLVYNTINSAIKIYRDSDSKIIFFQHNSEQLMQDTFDWEIDERINKDSQDLIIQKRHGNAFEDTDLKTTLTNLKIKSITICGLVSHGCVKATCIGGLTEGFETRILKNGHTNWNKDAELKILRTELDLKDKGIIIEEIVR